MRAHTHSRIMIINPQGEVHNALNQQQISTYDDLRKLCDKMFPFVNKDREVIATHARTHARTHPCTHAHIHAHAHARTRARMHTQATHAHTHIAKHTSFPPTDPHLI